MKIPTYIINLNKRTDRLEHIRKEFAHRDEFNITIFEAFEHVTGAIGLWKSIGVILKKALENEVEDFILICEDDHQFTELSI